MEAARSTTPLTEAVSPSKGKPSKGKHSPERSCVACRRKRLQGEFVRLNRLEGVWTIQIGSRSGRGSYLCADSPACWAEKRLKRSFGAQAVSVSAQLLNRSTPTTME